MGWLNVIGEAIEPVTELIDSLHTSDEERLKARRELEKARGELTRAAMEHEQQLTKMQRDVVTAEAQGKGVLQRNWRPVTMLTFLVLVVADTFGWTEFRLSGEAWTLLQIGLGGYVVGRSGEKIAPSIGRAMERKKGAQ